MKMRTAWAALLIASLLSLSFASPAVQAASNGIDIQSVAACRDTTTVTVTGSSTYATNRVVASVSYLNDKGKYVLLQQTTSFNFGSGDFWIPIVLDYQTHPVDADTSLQIIVQLQRSTGSGFTNLGDSVTTYVTAADRYCANHCSVTLSTSDRAPARGVITLRTHFGSWFRPEGWLQGIIPVNAGQAVQATLAGVSCDAWVRAWYYPATGTNRTPRLLPAQYWPDEYGTLSAGASAPYATSFAKGLPATMPLESGDPFAPH